MDWKQAKNVMIRKVFSYVIKLLVPNTNVRC